MVLVCGVSVSVYGVSVNVYVVLVHGLSVWLRC